MSKSEVFFIEVKNYKDKVQVASKFKQLIKKSGLCEDFPKGELVAIKMHMGEKGNLGHVDAQVVKALVDKIKSKAAKPFVTDTNVLYHGQRVNSVDHLMLANEHKFNIETLGCPVIIADGLLGENAEEVTINKKHFAKVSIAKPVLYLENAVSIAHVTGHIVTGLAASIKNIGMGFSSRAGKLRQHSNIKPQVKENKCVLCQKCIERCPASAIVIKNEAVYIKPELCIGCAECVVACKFDAITIDYGEDVRVMVEKMVEYAFGVLLKIKRKAFFNFAIKITRDCDCLAKDDPLIVEDVGIFGSTDPVACDKAAADMVLEKAKIDVFKKGYPQASHYLEQLTYAAKIGLGNLDYELVNISE